jgi:hypothetical protein
MSKVTASTPYVAPGAPRSPLLLAVAGLLVALASALASRLGFELPTDAGTTAMVAGLLASLVGYGQHLLARREQAEGSTRLDEVLAEAFAEVPPPGAVLEAVERVRARLAGLPAPELATGPRVERQPAPRRATVPPWEDAVGESLRPPTAAEQLHALDPTKPLGLDPWAGMALREILAGTPSGAVGPIEWMPGPARGVLRVVIDGTSRIAAVGDERSIAAALGAELWLEASKNASAGAAQPRSRVHSNALLGDDGEPVSAGDLDSGEISDDPPLDDEADPDERTTERVGLEEVAP